MNIKTSYKNFQLFQKIYSGSSFIKLLYFYKVEIIHYFLYFLNKFSFLLIHICLLLKNILSFKKKNIGQKQLESIFCLYYESVCVTENFIVMIIHFPGDNYYIIRYRI